MSSLTCQELFVRQRTFFDVVTFTCRNYHLWPDQPVPVHENIKTETTFPKCAANFEAPMTKHAGNDGGIYLFDSALDAPIKLSISNSTPAASDVF